MLHEPFKGASRKTLVINILFQRVNNIYKIKHKFLEYFQNKKALPVGKDF
jgi:hypothetical protein